MSPRERHIAFALCAVILTVAWVLVWLIDAPSHASRRAGPLRHPLVLGGGAPQRQEASATPSIVGETTETPAAQRALLATVAKFAGAFVRYEVGQLPAPVRQALRASATPAFAAQLLGAPPSVPQGSRAPAPAVVLSISPGEVTPGSAVTAVIELRRQNRLSPLTVMLSGGEGRWRVDGLG